MMIHQQLLTALAFARPGGGHTFSGGHFGGGHSGGGGGGSADLVVFLVELVIDYPAVGVPVTAAVVIFWVLNQRTHQRQEDWHAGSTPVAPETAPSVPRRKLELLAERPGGGQPRPYDPDFSLVLFEDFVYALYAQAQQARGRGTLDELAAYLGPPARNALRASPSPEGLCDVTTVIIGAMTYVDVSGITPGSDQVRVELEFQANFTEVSASPDGHQKQQSYYTVERWLLSRAATARSRPPARAKTLDCPNCGAPLSAVHDNVCSYCGQTVGTGQFHWLATGIELREKKQRGPQLMGDTEERGTELRTLFDPDLEANGRALVARDPAFTWEAFRARLTLIFDELQVAWSSLEWPRIRPYVSDNLFQMLLFWIEAYKQARLRNVLENTHIFQIEIARVSSDRYYDAITARVHAGSLDYTVDAQGKVVSGHRHRERKYTEYWTLIRGSEKRGAATTGKNCPNCGAPIAINMAGNCEYCHARVTSGDFDWVLSRIEQDETYQG